MRAIEIVEAIEAAKPELPEQKFLDQITFKWNEEGLSPWDGGTDLNEDLREEVVELLDEKFSKQDFAYANILRFLLQQETANCYEAEMLTEVLHECYDSLAELEQLEDIPLLLAANDASFDANCGLYKNRLFYKGYQNVMNYLRSNKNINQEIIDSVQHYAEQYGYDKRDVKPEERRQFE